MRVLFDSSSFAKRFIQENGSEEVDKICEQTSELGLSIICFPEIISALNRRVREKNIMRHEYVIAKQRLVDELEDAQIIHLTSSVIATAGTLLETNILRAMDALHIACAIEWKPDLFVTSDQQQAIAAKQVRLSVKIV
ncbi:MAG: type II toxin-antitoxin system VapC family toxin [SAR324 cluster bacterium]|nr:type II toxin-antitoxin system VapC family toxin [SAR324 cluster bacterium]